MTTYAPLQFQPVRDSSAPRFQQRFMNSSDDTASSTSVTVYAVALPPQATIPVLDAAEVAGYGFRQYPTVDSLLESASPSATGCVLLACGSDAAQNAAVIARMKLHFYSIPLIVLLDSNSADNAVDLMQQGAFSVLPQPFEHHKLLHTITAAVEFSESSQSAIDSSRAACLRMQEATEKELEVLRLIMDGRKNKEIAAELGITVRAVEDRRFRLMKKVGVDSVAELVALAVTAQYYQQGLTFGSPRNGSLPDIRRCVKGIEVWVPNEDETHLQLFQSCYRDAAAFQEASRGLTFRRGEGLPGRVWESRTPAFLRELITTDFVRSREASVVGMTTAVGLPVFCEGRVQSVVLILLDTRNQTKAVFESWRLDPQSSALRLSGGTYINCERLRRLSEFIHLPVGEGLAGFAAEQGRPHIGARFSEDAIAVRGLALAAENFVSSIALPLTDSGAVISDVFLLLNSEQTPVFSLLQIWKPTPDQSAMTLAGEYVDGIPSLTSQTSVISRADDHSIAGQAWTQRSPIIVDNGTAAQAIVRSPRVPAPGFGIAIPTIVGGKVVAVTVMAN
ncbi:MAG: LuxR C-terminal-related transcriptional regulator [Fuerstiella sp.]